MFDIDKMFLARFNYKIKNGKLRKVQYDYDKFKRTRKATTEELQNMLLDIYQTLLTADDHQLAARTPLDVSTGPLKDFLVGASKKYQTPTTELDDSAQMEKYDGYYLTPTFQTKQKEKNAGSDQGIGPMALNSVFRYFIQASGLKLKADEVLQKYGLNNIQRIYDNNGEDILDLTSALINAFVDAVKDNYIGRGNVNGFTFDVTSFLVTSGFGHNTFALLTQPIIMKVASKFNAYKNGKIGITDAQSGMNYIYDAIDEFCKENGFDAPGITNVAELNGFLDGFGMPNPSDLDMSSLEHSLAAINKDSKKAQEYYQSLSDAKTDEEKYKLLQTKPVERNNEWFAKQMSYLNLFRYLKDVADEYHTALSCAQVDTKKYGLNAAEIISFIQTHDQFLSESKFFENPEVLFTNTFLNEKYIQGVEGMFNVFGDTIFEFSKVTKEIADTLAIKENKYGKFSKDFLKRAVPRIKSVMLLPFFNQYLHERFPDSERPLAEMVLGENGVLARFNKIKMKALMSNMGTTLFTNNLLTMNFNPNNKGIPQFVLISNILRDNPYLKSNIQMDLNELFNSDDKEIRQWAQDFAVYMFYLTGGTDANAGGNIRTTLYDLMPPQHLANLEITMGDGTKQTLNEYTEQKFNNLSSVDEATLDHIMMLTMLTEDNAVPVIKNSPKNKSYVMNLVGENNGVVQVIGRQAQSLQDKNGHFAEYVKMKGRKGKYIFYKLGNIITTPKRDGEGVWVSPVYYRMQSLGYRDSKINSFSIRADGEIQSDGSIKSLFNMQQGITKNDKLYPNFAELPEKYQTQIQKRLDQKSGKIWTIQEYESSLKEGPTIESKPVESTETKGDLAEISKHVNTVNSTSYDKRTEYNAKNSDVTLQFGINLGTTGEKSTAKHAGSKLITFDLKNPDATAYAKNITTILNNPKNSSSGLTVNIAGNGLKTFVGYNQNDIDELIYNNIRNLIKNGVKINKIISGGQTGVDEAGIKAAMRLNIDWEINTTKDYKFRTADGTDIKSKELFLARFDDTYKKFCKS